EAGTAGTGQLFLNSGNNSGELQIDGQVKAGAAITLNAAGGAANATTLLDAPNLQIRAATGIGNLNSIQLRSATVLAETSSGNISLNSVAPAVCTSLTTSEGDIFYNGNGPTDIVSASTNAGDITVQTTAGRLTLQNITASSGSVVLRTFESGGILADNVSASGTLFANSADFIAELNEDLAAELRAAQIQLVAVNGIGSDGKLIEV
ncbi:MAG: DUF4097 family beta strand repeat-containing protein, partial [Planctomycetaceae bacterium]